MQGHQHFEEKTLSEFRLSERVPASSFYRRLKDLPDWEFLYQSTAPYQGKCGHQSIDPVVFFKLVLVGYLENIASDRRLIEHCPMRLDILYFLGFNLDDHLPWHSTVSRTRQLPGQEVSEALFERVPAQCVEKGMVAGEKQCMDSAFVKANAWLDSLEENNLMAAFPDRDPSWSLFSKTQQVKKSRRKKSRNHLIRSRDGGLSLTAAVWTSGPCQRRISSSANSGAVSSTGGRPGNVNPVTR